MRSVARQLTWRMSSSGSYSRIDSNSVPSPSGPRVSRPADAEASLADGEREPARGRHVGVDRDLVLARALVAPAAETERTLAAQRDRAEHVAAAAARHDGGVERPVALARLDDQCRRRRLAKAHAAERALGRHAQRRRHAAREVARHLPGDLRAAPDRERVGRHRAHQHERRDPADRRRRERRQHGDRGEDRGGARRRAHRGTGTSPSAVRTASVPS